MKTVMLCCLLLAGCAFDKPVVQYTPDPSQQVKLQIDERLLVECPALPEDVSITTTDDILRAKGIDAKTYAACRARHNELAGIVRKNLEGQK